MTSLYLIEEPDARAWEPFALTRPIGEVLFGTMLLRERIERALGLPVTGYIGRNALAGFEEEGAPTVVSIDPPASRERIVALSSRYVPPDPGTRGRVRLSELCGDPAGSGLRLVVGEVTAGWILPAGASIPADPGENRLEAAELPGHLLPDAWTLMSANPERTSADLRAAGDGGDGPVRLSETDVPGVHLIGSDPVTVGPGVEIEPGVIFDTRGGPIHLAAGVRVRGPARVEGPSFFGPGTTVLGGTLSAVSCGPVCKLRGEIDSSVLFGYVNKAHDGYLGHALVGRWVNLGAMTTNSDLKNNYGTVRLPLADGERDTGLMKVGAFLGDHVKTGIGTLLSTGSIVGAGANVVSDGIAPRSIPPFAWLTPGGLSIYRKEAFLETAERAMARRDVPLSPGMRAMLDRAWEGTRNARSEAGGGRR